MGCILTQILNYWKSSITVTCTKRASPVAKALGAKEIINYETQDLENYEPSQDILSNKTLYKELKLREKFDFIIVTNKSALNFEKLQLCSKNKVVSTVQKKRPSDSCTVFRRLVIITWIYCNYWLEVIFVYYDILIQKHDNFPSSSHRDTFLLFSPDWTLTDNESRWIIAAAKRK